jgi:DNA-binding MarR family transcriptional regulator
LVARTDGGRRRDAAGRRPGAACRETDGTLPSQGPTMGSHAAPQARDETRMAAQAWAHLGDDFVLMREVKPPPRIEFARERMLMSRLYLGLIRSISDDYGAEFAAQSDSASFRAIGIYVFFRTLMCSPARASAIAHALRLPRPTVLRRLQELVKHGYVERVGNAYRVTDKVNIPDLEERLQRRIAMIIETARKLAEVQASHGAAAEPGEP